MKKSYEIPQMRICPVEMESALMAQSSVDIVPDTTKDGSTAKSKAEIIWLEEDW